MSTAPRNSVFENIENAHYDSEKKELQQHRECLMLDVRLCCNTTFPGLLGTLKPTDSNNTMGVMNRNVTLCSEYNSFISDIIAECCVEESDAALTNTLKQFMDT